MPLRSRLRAANPIQTAQPQLNNGFVITQVKWRVLVVFGDRSLAMKHISKDTWPRSGRLTEHRNDLTHQIRCIYEPGW